MQRIAGCIQQADWPRKLAPVILMSFRQHTKRSRNRPLKKTARLAGLLYLVFGLPTFFGLMYVPSRLIVHGDAATTAHNIVASEFLFRAGIVSNLIGQIGFISIPLTLYLLFKAVNNKLAWLMVALFGISIPISVLNELNQIAVLAVLHSTPYLAAFEKPQLDALVMVFLGVYNHGNFLAQIFWGLWLLPFGILILKSDLMPRMLGVLLIVSCFSYLISTFTFLLVPAYAPVISTAAAVPAGLGEVLVVLWLLIKGVKDQRAGPLATAP